MKLQEQSGCCVPIATACARMNIDTPVDISEPCEITSVKEEIEGLFRSDCRQMRRLSATMKACHKPIGVFQMF